MWRTTKFIQASLLSFGRAKYQCVVLIIKFTWSMEAIIMINKRLELSTHTIHGRDVQKFRKSEFESSKQEILPWNFTQRIFHRLLTSSEILRFFESELAQQQVDGFSKQKDTICKSWSHGCHYGILTIVTSAFPAIFVTQICKWSTASSPSRVLCTKLNISTLNIWTNCLP